MCSFVGYIFFCKFTLYFAMFKVIYVLMFTMAGFCLVGCEGNPNIGKLVSQQSTVGCTDPLASNYNSNAKTGDCSCNYTFNSTIGVAPTQFTKKVFIEKFTGAWCGWCPYGSDVVKAIEAANPGKVAAVEVHQGDLMEVTTAYKYYESLFSSVGNFPFPSALINRAPSIQANQQLMEDRDQWTANANAELTKTPILGLAIETKPVDGLPTQEQIMVKVAFAQTPTSDSQLIVYLVENNIIYRQYRYQVGGTGGYIDNYQHDKVFRKALTGVEGVLIPACGAQVGKTFTQMFKADLSGLQRNNCEIVAFVVNKSATATPMRVLNAQKVKLGEVKNWE